MSIEQTQSGSGCALGGIGCGCLGCGGGVLVVLALLAGLTWFFVWQPINEFTTAWQPPAQTQNNESISTNEPPLRPTNDSVKTDPDTTSSTEISIPFTKEEVEQFVNVRQKIRQAFGENFSQLEDLVQNLETGQSPDLWQMLIIARNVTSSVNQARQVQTQALEQTKISLERYNSIRASVNRVLLMPNFDFSQVAQDIKNGTLPDIDDAVKKATPEEQELIEPFKQELQQTAALGLLGL